MTTNITAGLAALSAALVVLAVAMGISKIGSSANEAIARQPEAAAKIQTAMLITAALIEGVGLFGAVIALLAMNS